MDGRRGNDDFDAERASHTDVPSSAEVSEPPGRVTGSGGRERGDEGMTALSYILAGVLFYGGLGWLVGRWLHQPWLIAVGLIAGMAASTYVISKRFGSNK